LALVLLAVAAVFLHESPSPTTEEEIDNASRGALHQIIERAEKEERTTR